MSGLIHLLLLNITATRALPRVLVILLKHKQNSVGGRGQLSIETLQVCGKRGVNW